VAFRREAEFLQRLEIKLERDRRGIGDEADVPGPLEIRLVGVLVIALLRREAMLMEAALGDVGVELIFVRRTAAVALAVRAAKSRKRPSWLMARGSFTEKRKSGGTEAAQRS